MGRLEGRDEVPRADPAAGAVAEDERGPWLGDVVQMHPREAVGRSDVESRHCAAAGIVSRPGLRINPEARA